MKFWGYQTLVFILIEKRNIYSHVLQNNFLFQNLLKGNKRHIILICHVLGRRLCSNFNNIIKKSFRFFIPTTFLVHVIDKFWLIYCSRIHTYIVRVILRPCQRSMGKLSVVCIRTDMTDQVVRCCFIRFFAVVSLYFVLI